MKTFAIVLCAALSLFGTACRSRQAAAYRQTPVSVSASDLAAAFRDDAKATEQYTGKMLKVTGEAEGTGTDLNGVPFVFLKGSGGVLVQCFFAKESAEKGAQIEKGRTVTVQGLCGAKVIHVALIECVFPS
jgi:hypothetical protein